MKTGPTCHQAGIRGYGSTESGVCFVGIAPGAAEMKAGRPLVGPSGRLLDAVLQGVGVPRSIVYCTNLVCTHHDAPTAGEIAACRNRLIDELHDVRPWLIISLGSIVADVLHPARPLKEIRGVPLWNGASDHYSLPHYYMPMYHPAGVLHGGVMLIHDIVRDAWKIPRILDWPRDGSIGDVEVTVLHDYDLAQRILNELPRDRPIGIDIETNYGEGDVEQIDVFSDKLRSVAISDGEHTYAFNADLARMLVFPPDVQWTMHNGMFDAQGIRQYLDVRLPIVHDTMLASYNLDERAGRHGLKKLAAEYEGAGFYAIDTKRLQDYSDDEVLAYNGKDAAYTARLMPKFLARMEADGVLQPYNTLLIPAANAFTDICLRGVHVNMARVQELKDDWLPRHQYQSERLIALAKDVGFLNPSVVKKIQARAFKKGMPLDALDYASHPDAITINVRSPKQLSHLLYNILELPGGPSTKRSVLESLEGEHPFVDTLLSFRRLDHTLSHYLLAMERHVRLDGRLHPNVLLHGTRTGRLSYQDPPLQTIPNEFDNEADKYLARIRDVFDVEDADESDEWIMIGADYEKAEVWSAAYLSGDDQMLADLQGPDFHRTVAAAVFGVLFKDVTRGQRQMAKKVTFGIFYGSTAVGLALLLKITTSVAQGLIDNFNHRYWKYHEWYERQRTTAIKEGELVGPTGRKRRFLMVVGEEAHRMLNQAVNSPVQTLATDVCLSSLIECHNSHDLRRTGTSVLLSLHDAIYFEARRKHLPEVVPIVTEIMTAPRFHNVPGIPIEIKVGTNLGNLKEYAA